MKPTSPIFKAVLAAAAIATSIIAADPADAALADTSFYAYTYPTGGGVAIGCEGGSGTFYADNAIELHANRYSGVFVCGDIGGTRIDEADGNLNGFILWLLLP